MLFSAWAISSACWRLCRAHGPAKTAKGAVLDSVIDPIRTERLGEAPDAPSSGMKIAP
jgi:hypothetical protein